MILIGQYDSPFVRRVGIAMSLYGIVYEHRPWSVFGNADEIAAYNPLVRVPTLILDDGTVLMESHNIIDYLDNQVPAEEALFPRTEPDRHRALRIAALATGIADKAVSLFYEQRLHTETSAVWIKRCGRQIAGALTELEQRLAERGALQWYGTRMGHADIAVGAALRFVGDAHPGLIDLAAHPRLADLSARLEALPVFKSIQQPFHTPT